MSSDKFHCTNGHCLTDCVLSSIDYDKAFPPAFCPHSGGVVRWKKCETTEKKQTLFDRITQSPEGLAEALVRSEHWTITSESPEKGIEHEYWTSIFIDMLYPTKAEAIAATVARLKEMCDE